MENDRDPITQATALLTCLMHCRRQAQALQACQRDGGGCDREAAVFTTCAQSNLPLVIGHLIKVADKNCPEEIEVVQRCRTLRPGDDCEAEETAAMRCAALRVLASAHSTGYSRTSPAPPQADS